MKQINIVGAKIRRMPYPTPPFCSKMKFVSFLFFLSVHFWAYCLIFCTLKLQKSLYLRISFLYIYVLSSVKSIKKYRIIIFGILFMQANFFCVFFEAFYNHKLQFTMKKVLLSSLLALTAFFCASTSSLAQFSKGDKKVNIGVGLGSIGANASVEYGIMDDLGVGLFASYERPNTGLVGAALGVRYSYNEINIGPRAAYHLNRVLNMKDEKFDLYVAGGVLYRHVTYPYDYWYGSGVDSSYGSIRLLARVGAGFQFTNNLSGFAELGSGGSWLQAGISFKF